MAKDVITRFKLETTGFDSKLKQAAKGMADLGKSATQAGKSFNDFTKDNVAAARALGSMETSTTNAKDKVKELVGAFNEAAKAYNSLTKEQQQSDWAKALASSLEQLKQRIGETKTQLGDITKEMNGGGGLKDALDAVAGKFGLSIDQVTKFGGVVAVTTTAVKVAKDAFFQSESNIDEWGRTVEGAKGAYDVFLQTINNGNWSNFFTNLSTAIQGARDLYDALDRLGSIKSNNQAAIAIVQQQIAQLRLMKQQGKDVDDQLKAATANLAALQKQAVTAGKNAGAATMQQTIRNGVNSMGGAYVNDKTIEAAIGGILHKGQAEFDKYKQTVNKFENWSKAQKVTTQVIPDSQGGTYTKTSREFDINLLTKEQQRQYKLAKAITERETEIQKGIAIYAQAVQEGTANAREEFKGNRYALQGSGGGSTGGKGGGTTTTAATEKEVTIQQQIAKLEQEAYTASDERRVEIAKQVQELDKELEKQKAIRDEVHGIVKEQTEQKRLADAMVSGAQAMINNDLKGWYAANQKVIAAGGQAQDIPVSFSLTSDNLDAFKKNLKEQLNDAEIGSDLYNALTSQLADANMLGNFISVALANGINVADIDPQTLWSKIFGDGQTAGDYIPDSFWEGLGQQFKEVLGKGMAIDTNTGEVKTQGNKGDDFKELNSNLSKVTGGLSQVFGGLKSIGIEIPQEIDNLIGFMSGLSQVISGVGSIVSLFSTSSMVANTTAVGLNTGAITALIAAIETSTAAHMIKFWSNGGVVHAAQGLIVPGNNFSGDMVPSMINSGELILNKSQQNVIASQLENGGMSNLRLSTEIDAESIKIILNNYGERTEQGEYLRATLG